jgi:hypothetical protein
MQWRRELVVVFRSLGALGMLPLRVTHKGENVLRVISMVEVSDGANVSALVAAGRDVVDHEPAILRGEVEPGLRMLEDFAPHAAYSLVLDFQDEQAFRRYMDGAPHAAFAALAAPFITRVTTTQYHRVDGSPL